MLICVCLHGLNKAILFSLLPAAAAPCRLNLLLMQSITVNAVLAARSAHSLSAFSVE